MSASNWFYLTTALIALLPFIGLAVFFLCVAIRNGGITLGWFLLYMASSLTAGLIGRVALTDAYFVGGPLGVAALITLTILTVCWGIGTILCLIISYYNRPRRKPIPIT